MGENPPALHHADDGRVDGARPILVHFLLRLGSLRLRLLLCRDGPDADLDLLARELVIEAEHVLVVHIPAPWSLGKDVATLQFDGRSSQAPTLPQGKSQAAVRGTAP